MREIRLYGSEGGGAVCSPYPYRFHGAWRRRVGMRDSRGIASQPVVSDCNSGWQCAHHSVVHTKNVQPLFQMQRAERQTQVGVSFVRKSSVIQIPP